MNTLKEMTFKQLLEFLEILYDGHQEHYKFNIDEIVDETLCEISRRFI